VRVAHLRCGRFALSRLAYLATASPGHSWLGPRRTTHGNPRSPIYRASYIEPAYIEPAYIWPARIQNYLRVQIMPTFGDSPLSKISRLFVQAWVDALAESLGPRTVRDSYRVFSSFMREAERQGLIRQSPCYSIVLPRMPRPEPRFLAPDEVERLAEAIDARYEALIYTGAYLGPRWSELAGLKRMNLDLAERRERIVGSLEKVGNGWRYSGQLKTPRSRRTLSVPPFIIDLLAEHLSNAPPNEFVFSSPCGDILNYGNFMSRFWKPAVAKASLVAVTTHALRHTCVALMIAQREPSHGAETVGPRRPANDPWHLRSFVS
jgi:integrase